MSSPSRRREHFTLRLNAALERLMGDVGLSDVNRVYFTVVRHGWGNWYPYAIHGTNHHILSMASLYEQPGAIEGLLIGPGPCPLCGRNVKRTVNSYDTLPQNWRWHIPCLATAFALDALEYGGEKEKEWARQTIAECAGGAQ